ncbi:MAG: hypothetical protein H6907_09865 [Hyphomicrobiales bacterium]|nr:hypothetical protein [Hyphomicrobiales bacterium]MCP5372025.1 hypothetical protein [Hyphomicrobiales bacterium]
METTTDHPSTRRGAGRLLAALLLAAAALGAALGVALAPAPASAQVPAFLPMKDAVEPGPVLPTDGVWTISTIGKRIRIEAGRAYAVDPWLHLFVLQVQPDMVVLRNFRQAGPGTFTADDLPLLGPATFRLTSDGRLNATVQGSLGPVGYVLIPQQVDDQAALDAEVAALNGGGGGGGGTPPPSDGEPPRDAPPPADAPPADDRDPPAAGRGDLATCKNLGIDPKTGDVVCMD